MPYHFPFFGEEKDEDPLRSAFPGSRWLHAHAAWNVAPTFGTLAGTATDFQAFAMTALSLHKLRPLTPRLYNRHLRVDGFA